MPRLPREERDVTEPASGHWAGDADVAEPLELFGRRQLLRMLDHLPGLVAWWGPDLRNRYANAPYHRWFGVSAERLRGLHMRELVGAEAFGRTERYVEGALAGEPQAFERTMVDARGEQRSTMTRFVPAT